jgi:hypothetical protein
MLDQDLDRRLTDCKELLLHWHKFHSYFNIAIKEEGKISHEVEAEFLNLKSRIAMLHDAFMESLKHDQAIGQHVLTIVERSITIKHLKKMSIAEIKKMEIEWHESYLLLNETVGAMEEEETRLDNINPTKYKLDKLKTSIINNIRNFLTSIYLKLALVVLGIPVGFIILNEFWPLKQLGEIKITAPVYHGVRNAMRIVMPGLSYHKIEDISRNEDGRPEGIQDGKTKYDKNKAANLFMFAGFSDYLKSANVKFKEEAYKFNNRSPLHFLIFLINDENEDPCEKALEFKDNYDKWINSLPAGQRNIMQGLFTVFNKNNALIMIESSVSNKTDREQIMVDEFGVSD